jgi:3-oxoacyl-[acyl-carrier-protein] synthase-3
MNFTNIHILGTAIYHPETKFENKYFEDHFNKLGMEVTGLLTHLDRKERYLIQNENENVLTMVVNAAHKVLDKVNMSPRDIDMLVFVSDTPEYTNPCNALILHNELMLKNACIAFDFNNNCIGMVTAIDFVGNYMKQKKNIKNVLMLGGQMVSKFAKDDDTITFATSGDGAAAIVLQAREEDKERGLINSCFKVDSHLSDKMRFPGCGMSRILDESIETCDKKMFFIPHDVSYFSDEWTKLIKRLLEDNKLDIENINHYFFSQFSHADIYSTLDKLNVDYKKHTFIADKYGYTGCTSPIFALNDAIDNKRIKHGDYAVFCSVGIGYSMASLLYKF